MQYHRSVPHRALTASVPTTLIVLLAAFMALAGRGLTIDTARAQIGDLTLCEVGGVPGTDFTVEFDPFSAGASVFADVAAGGCTGVELDPDTSYLVTQGPEQGHTHIGWAETSGVGCPLEPDSDGSSTIVTIDEGDNGRLCTYNSAEGTLRIVKIGGAGAQFEFDIDGPDSGTVAVNGNDAESFPVPAGIYEIGEEDEPGWELAGWALPAGNSCPSSPSIATDEVSTIVEVGESTTVCAYNVPDTAFNGTLKITQVGAPPADVFTIDVTTTAFADTMAVPGGGSNSDLFPAANYSVSARPLAGVTILGWAQAGTGDICPGNPSVASPTTTVTVNAAQTTSICLYATRTGDLDGTLQIRKVGGVTGTTFTFEIDGTGSANDTALNVNANNQNNIDLPAGNYDLSEQDEAGHTFLGWANTVNGQCPSTPTTTADEVDITIETDEVRIICAYNQADSQPTITYRFEFRWTLFTWLGEDGADIDDALNGGLGLTQTTDIADEVLSIWAYDQGEQAWIPFFPGQPQFSDFTEFQQFQSYFVAIEPPGPVLWTIPSEFGN